MQNTLLFITSIGNTKSIILISICVILLLWLLRRPLAIIYFFAAMSASAISIHFIKMEVARVRPKGLFFEEGFSFPSGHALGSTVLFLLIFYFFKQYIKTIWIKRLVGVLTILIILLIGYTRLYFNVHYLSDVIGGYIIGCIIFSITVLAVEANKRKFKKLSKLI